ncbi:MAG: DMT family transporter [Lentisphaeria bacterium]|nr:DMT family transporter [Lentisphaeria bacterium]
MMFSFLPVWFLPTVLSAFALGFYDICKKHAVNNNSVMPVLFWATFSGSLLYVTVMACCGRIAAAAVCTSGEFTLVLLKSLLVSSSWICVYYAMRELPISLASPIRASSPVWTVLGGVLLFQELPSWGQAAGMLIIFAGYWLFAGLGKKEGFPPLSKGVLLILAGTILGASSALYDKYLLNVCRLPREMLQFYFSVDLVFVLGAACLIRKFVFKQGVAFKWKWSVPLTGILLILADYAYFYAVSMPDIHISILSLVRRCSCIVTFAFGVWYFRDLNIRRKVIALALILAGVAILALTD